MDEREIRVCVARARSGDPEGFADLFGAFEADVTRLCRRMLGGRDEAQDAGSEAFLRAQRAFDQYKDAQPFRSWLLAIAAHHCVDRIRRRSREARIFEPEEAGDRVGGLAPSPLDRVIRIEEGDRLRRAIEGLSDRYRVPVVMRYFADLDYGDIAETLEVSRAQVATLLFRGRRQLRAALAEESRP